MRVYLVAVDFNTAFSPEDLQNNIGLVNQASTTFLVKANDPEKIKDSFRSHLPPGSSVRIYEKPEDIIQLEDSQKVIEQAISKTKAQIKKGL